MRKSAMQNIHDMNQRAIISYANHDLQRLKNQFGTGQGTTNKKPQQSTNTSNKKSSSLWDELNEGNSNKKSSSLWDELNEGKSKQESGNFESSNVVYIKNPPVINQQLAQPQNLQLEQMLKRIEELEQSLVQSRQENQEQTNTIQEQTNTIEEQTNTIQDKNNKILEVSNKNMELQEKLLEKTEQITIEINKYNAEHNKLVNTKHKVNLVKVKLDDFINNHEGIEDQDQLVEMLGDLNIEE